jgi:hypothetical protein
MNALRSRWTLALLPSLAIAAACSSESTGPSGDAGASTDSAQSGNDGGLHDGGLVVVDAAPGTFGATCTSDSDCTDPVYNKCFIGGQQSFCSKPCSTASDCPNPPTSGVCNMKGLCK